LTGELEAFAAFVAFGCDLLFCWDEESDGGLALYVCTGAGVVDLLLPLFGGVYVGLDGDAALA
jgi:hypothetical protein